VPTPERDAAPAGRWSLTPVRGLAVCAVPLLAYELWTLVGWLGDGPFEVTAYRAHNSTSWYAARVVEAVVVASVGGFLWKAVRDRRRLGRLSTDALLIIGMFTAAFWDPIYNWLAPAWFYTSNFLNVNDWLAHAPLIVNPDAGRMPWPVILVCVGYPLWGVGFAAIVSEAMGRLRAHRPTISRAVLVGLAFALGGAVTALGFGVFQALGLMTAPGYRLGFLGNSELAFFFYSGGLVFGGLACLRFFKDADGRTLLERERSGSTRVLAAIAACQIVVVVGWGLLTVPFSLDPSPYPRLARDLVNGLCNAPGVHRTDYGPCPGSPGFRLPTK
jgi:hypothetical protein